MGIGYSSMKNLKKKVEKEKFCTSAGQLRRIPLNSADLGLRLTAGLVGTVTVGTVGM